MSQQFQLSIDHKNISNSSLLSTRTTYSCRKTFTPTSVHVNIAFTKIPSLNHNSHSNSPFLLLKSKTYKKISFQNKIITSQIQKTDYQRVNGRHFKFLKKKKSKQDIYLPTLIKKNLHYQQLRYLSKSYIWLILFLICTSLL